MHEQYVLLNDLFIAQMVAVLSFDAINEKAGGKEDFYFLTCWLAFKAKRKKIGWFW